MMLECGKRNCSPARALSPSDGTFLDALVARVSHLERLHNQHERLRAPTEKEIVLEEKCDSVLELVSRQQLVSRELAGKVSELEKTCSKNLEDIRLLRTIVSVPAPSIFPQDLGDVHRPTPKIEEKADTSEMHLFFENSEKSIAGISSSLKDVEGAQQILQRQHQQIEQALLEQMNSQGDLEYEVSNLQMQLDEQKQMLASVVRPLHADEESEGKDLTAQTHESSAGAELRRDAQPDEPDERIPTKAEMDATSGAEMQSVDQPDEPRFTKPVTDASPPCIVRRIANDMNDMDSVPARYEFKASVWDLAFFCGTYPIGIAGSVWIAFLYVLNASLQLLLIFFINDILTDKQIDDGVLQDMNKWRRDSAHAWDFADKWTRAPLADRICDNDKSVPMSSGIANILETIRAYHPRDKDFEAMDPYFGRTLPDMPYGSVMSIVAIVIWLCMVWKDAEEIANVMWAIYHLPKGKTNIQQTADARTTLKSISTRRQYWCISVTLLRGVVAICLCLNGSLFIAFTISVEELLLNAAALQVVIELDDIIFEALAPNQAANLLRSMQPLQQRSIHAWKGLNWTPVISLSMIICAVVWLVVQVLVPQNELLDLTRDAICGGNTDFVVLFDKAGILYASPVQEGEVPAEYRSKAMAQLFEDPDSVVQSVTGEGSLSAQSVGTSGGIWSMASISEMDVDEASASWNADCIDMLSPSGEKHFSTGVRSVFRIVLESTIGRLVPNCESVKYLCSVDKEAGIRARQVCPETCGCTHLGSHMILAHQETGCPPACEKKPTYETSLASRPCQDEVAPLENSPILTNYVEGLKSFQSDIYWDWVADIDKMIDKIRRLGCATTTTPWKDDELKYEWSNMCEVSTTWWGLQPLTFACPEACGCDKHFLPYCPVACRNSTTA